MLCGDLLFHVPWRVFDVARSMGVSIVMGVSQNGCFLFFSGKIRKKKTWMMVPGVYFTKPPYIEAVHGISC